MPSIKLESSDKKVFNVEVEVASCSVAIKTMLDQLGMNEGGEEEVIPLLNVNSIILEKIISWATHHKDDAPSTSTVEGVDEGRRDISSWDAEFLAKVDKDTLFELIRAANFLDIKGLLDVTCKTAANMIKGKSPEGIRETFNIKNDFIPTEKEHICTENQETKEK